MPVVDIPGLSHLYLLANSWSRWRCWRSRLTNNKTWLAIHAKHTHTHKKASIKFPYGRNNYRYRSLKLKGEMATWKRRLSCPGEKRSRAWMPRPGRLVTEMTKENSNSCVACGKKQTGTTTSFAKKMIWGRKFRLLGEKKQRAAKYSFVLFFFKMLSFTRMFHF